MTRRSTNLIAVLAVALLAVACSGGGASAPPATAATVGPATQPPASAPPTPVPPTPSASVPVSVPPASVPPAPTGTPSATPTPAPVATPSPVAGPTACDHLYWPLRLGATWTMAAGDVTSVLTVVDVQGDAISAIALLQSVAPSGSKFTNEILCTADEGMAYGDALFENTDGRTGTKDLFELDGPQLPPVSALVDGATFRNASTSDLDFPNYDADGKYLGRVVYQIVIDQTCAVKGPRDIEIPAGTFNGFEITCKGSSTRKESGKADQRTDYNTTAYWLEGVGFSGIEGGSQLVSYSIPPR